MKKIRFTDYSSELPDLDFKYDETYYPNDEDLPDPQLNPTLPGSHVALQKVGIGPVELPLFLKRRDGTVQEVYAKASLYGSLDFEHQKGLNLSRFYLLMHEAIADHVSIDALKEVLKNMREKQNCTSAYCKLRFNYRWYQNALRTREELPDDAPESEVFKTVGGVKLSHKKKQGHIFYACELEGQMHGNEYKFFLTVNYRYSSTCPCSFTLAQDARVKRGKAANGHSQRSTARITVQLDPNKPMWIEDVVELARTQIPTEVVVVCKRRDEMAFAELNGSNLLFTEDASRLLYQGLDQWYEENKILDFSIVTEHEESLHPFNAIAVVYKGIPGGLR
jgi:GTP cyclohydrolase I